MSGYTPQVGDRVRLSHWSDFEFATVTAVGRDKFLAKDYYGEELKYALNWGWVKVPDPAVYPERWINVYADHVMNGGWCSRADADRIATANRIAVIHLAADGTLTLHPVEPKS